MPTVSVPVSLGELVDKITILEIKAAELADPVRLGRVRVELELLLGVWRPVAAGCHQAVLELKRELEAVNHSLWRIEDEIRECERQNSFQDRFIELARLVYRTNDRRAALKSRINELLGSDLHEVKSYAGY